MEWLIAAGHHPRANATTLAVARDLGARMDFDTGHVRYCLDETAARLGVSRATVKRHVAVLRELGALAWVVHGTKTNIRRLLGLGGYAGTATIYAAVIPPVYDHAMGHTIVGSGYGARTVIDQRGQAPKAVDNSPVDNPSSGSCAPPSLTVVEEESQVQMVGGFNNTPRERASRRTAPLPHQTTSSNSQGQDGHTRRTPQQAAREIRETQLVRAMVNWTQGERVRRLAFVLRPFFDRGLNAPDIAAELHGLCLRGKPKQPATFIQARIARQAERDAARKYDLEHAVAPTDSPAWQAYQNNQHSLTALVADDSARTDEDRRRARLYAWDQWEDVADHYDEDPDDALDLYGTKLCSYAVGKAARAQEAYARV
ncbi:cell wall protein [Streptomyces rectiviolaceus]|uniref:cell wall protein n=1 Tax=Streptomyces rectiviolaceus TaxID=332591 RepID=UPI0031DC8155